MTDFSGRSALITGAASGIGLATAQLLASRGAARLLLVDRLAERIDAARATLPSAAWLAGDVADERFWAGIAPQLAGLDMAVVNAGVTGAGPITEIDFAEWRRIISVNLNGAFLSLRAALRAMNDGGAIVVTSSASGLKAEIGTGAYGASKAGLMQLMRVAAKESAARRIRVNAIAPAGVETPMWREMGFFNALADAQGGEAEAFAAMASAGTPLGRFATADEIARQIGFLLSDDAGTITGATLISDGGYLL